MTRLLDTVIDALRAGRTVERLAIPVAAWMLFVERQARAGVEVVDPLGDRLAEIGRGSDLVSGLLGIQQIFPTELAHDAAFQPALDKAVSAMRASAPRALNGEAK